MYTLFEDQNDIVNKTRQAIIDGHKNIMIQSPTGTGKTVIFSHLIYNAKLKSKKTLVITDRIELLLETDGTIKEFDLKPYNIMAGQKIPPPNIFDVYIAMSQTLRRRIGKYKWTEFLLSFDLIIIDEAHKEEFSQYFIDDCFNKNSIILGFSATPKRTGKQRSLSLDYTKLICGLQIPELIKRNRLVRDRYYSNKFVDLSKLKINSRGDFDESLMFERFNKTNIYHGVVDNWMKLTPNTITLCFCVNIQHAIATCKAFNDNGIKAKFIVSNLSKPKLTDETNNSKVVKYNEKLAEYEIYKKAISLYSGERSTIINSWKNGNFDILINASIFTTGFNHKPIETIIINRATISEILWLQMLGRGSRTFNGKKYFNVLDFGENGERLGYYNQEKNWNLQKPIYSDGLAPYKQCGLVKGKEKKDKNNNKGCGCYIFASQMICPYCGYKFELDKKEIKVILEEITYYDENELSKHYDIDFSELDRTAEERGHKFGWIMNTIISKGGEEALKAYALYRKFDNSWIWRMKHVYKTQIEKYNLKTTING